MVSSALATVHGDYGYRIGRLTDLRCGTNPPPIITITFNLNPRHINHVHTRARETIRRSVRLCWFSQGLALYYNVQVATSPLGWALFCAMRFVGTSSKATWLARLHMLLQKWNGGARFKNCLTSVPIESVRLVFIAGETAGFGAANHRRKPPPPNCT